MIPCVFFLMVAFSCFKTLTCRRSKMPCVWCDRRIKRRFQVFWEDLEISESDKAPNTSSHLTVQGAEKELARLFAPVTPAGGVAAYRLSVVEVSWCPVA